MNVVKEELIKIYKLSDECMLKGKLSRDNPFTYHHIIPVRENGQKTLENGAILTRKKHEQFNQLERLYPEYAAEINYYLYTYRGNYPEEVMERINELMSLVKDVPKKKVKTNKKYR